MFVDTHHRLMAALSAAMLAFDSGCKVRMGVAREVSIIEWFSGCQYCREQIENMRPAATGIAVSGRGSGTASRGRGRWQTALIK